VVGSLPKKPNQHANQAKLFQILDTHGAIVMLDMTTEYESVNPEIGLDVEL